MVTTRKRASLTAFAFLVVIATGACPDQSLVDPGESIRLVEFNPCTWGWILENCPSAECPNAGGCRQQVINTWIERAKRGECSAADASRIRLSCEACNRASCRRP